MATPGPWKVVGKDNWHLKEFPQVEMNTPDGKYFPVHNDADANFIANARQDIPALLDYIDKLNNELNKRQWVSVNDTLPHKDQLVLVAKGRWLNLKTFCIDDDGEKYWFDYITGERSEIKDYTHWMQPPLMPREASNAP